MEKSKFEEIVVNRINNDRKKAEEELDKRKQTIEYIYKKIIKDFDDELRKNIESYNEVLNEHYTDLKIFLFYGDNYSDTLESGLGKKILILIDNKSIHTDYGTPVTNFDHCFIYFNTSLFDYTLYDFDAFEYIYFLYDNTINKFNSIKINIEKDGK